MSMRGTIISFASESPKSTTFVIIWCSSFSSTPSSWLTSTTVRSSLSVIGAAFSFGSMRRINITPNESLFTIKITGVSSLVNVIKSGAYIRAIFSLCSVARRFGVISPKIRIKSVKIPVAIAAPWLPNSSSTTEVVREEADRFTTLLPIRMALNILAGFSTSFNRTRARLFPSSARLRTRSLLTVVREVSAEENRADNINRINSITNLTATLGGTKITLLFYYILDRDSKNKFLSGRMIVYKIGKILQYIPSKKISCHTAHLVLLYRKMLWMSNLDYTVIKNFTEFTKN